MNIGLIGAGKVGFSFGKYLTEHQKCVTGYYSRHLSSAKEAALFTATHPYETIDALVRDSDVILIAVPDDEIVPVWETIKDLPIRDKLICHFSGAHSSAVFSDIGRTHAFGYSIHPLFACHDKYTSYKELSAVHFTIEGQPDTIGRILSVLEGLKNPIHIISPENKIRYHAACAIASNLVVGLSALSESILGECGFSAEDAHLSLAPLIRNNAANIADKSPSEALTGPIERNDTQTIAAHLDAFVGDRKNLYRLLSKEVLKVARKKHPETDYRIMEEILQ